MVGDLGFEPRLPDPESGGLPLPQSPVRSVAERVGFEPTVAVNHTAFRERHLKPLGHLSEKKMVTPRGFEPLFAP